MKNYLVFAAIAGAVGVALGAFGAHGLKSILTARGTLHAWETAVLYQLVHAVALLSAGLHTSNADRSASWWRRACASWSVGMLLFSGSLVWLSLGGPRWIGPVTPIGGLALIGGWIFLAIGALTHSSAGNDKPTS